MKKALGLCALLAVVTSTGTSKAEEAFYSAKDKTISAEHQPYAAKKLLPNSKSNWIEIDWTSDWDDNHLHWDHPANGILYTDGSIYGYAHHLANMLRTGGILDTGQYFSFVMNFTLFERYVPETKSCAGGALASKDFVLRGLDYKQEAWDASVDGQLTDPDTVTRGNCLTITRSIR